MDRQWTVGASAALLAVENVAVLAGLLFAHSAPFGVVPVLLLKFPLCASLLRLQFPSAVLLILWESATMCVALVNTSISPAGQLALFASAMTGSTLLALSLPQFAPAPPGGTGGVPLDDLL